MRLNFYIFIAASYLTAVIITSRFSTAVTSGKTDSQYTAMDTYLTIKPPRLTPRRFIQRAQTKERIHDLPMPRMQEPSAYSPRPPVHLGMPDNFVFEMEFASMPHSTNHAVPSTWRTRKRDNIPNSDLTVPVD